jgi:ssDNA-binding replication factor A large subunit
MHIVQASLNQGLNLPETKIKDLRPGMRHVEVEGKVIRKEIVARSPKLLAKAIISDGTGEITLNLWREQVNQADIGDTIRVFNGFVRTWGGKPELSTWENIKTIRTEKK